MSFPCPCCGYLTLAIPPPGSFVICPVCCWEDDDAQFNDQDLAGGANRVSLRDARENFKRFAAADPNDGNATRAPMPEEFPPDELDPRAPRGRTAES